MHHFFIKKKDVSGDEILIAGKKAHHAVDVLRLKEGERISVSDEDGKDYLCEVKLAEKAGLRLLITERLMTNRELPSEVWLFQGLPKGDKMELIIRKATELGVAHIVPVATRYSVARLDEKRAMQKLARWQAIAESAAEQSKRSIVPKVEAPMSFAEAAKLAGAYESSVIPYEGVSGIESLSESLISFIPGIRIGIFIGPEGGFDPLEIKLAEMKGIKPVSLGKRILRTETAAIAMLSIVMIRLEIAEAAFKEDS